jgi:demethylmenaquinone methyltransferase / 2-methoxy-6-polyprenyl-1,4-benzoquinol methylase
VNGPLPPGPTPGKGALVAAMFGRIAPRYDLVNRVLSVGADRSWRREAARAALAGAPRRVLDVATGTGDLALLLARGPKAPLVTGVDFAPEMLELAREKAARAGLPLRLERADALALPFADAAFDAVTVAYGLRNFADVAAGLREMRRVLRPGGRLVVLEFPPPGERPIGRAIRWYGRTVMPTLGGWLSGDRSAYAYLPASTHAFLEPESLADALRAAGFGDVRYRLQTGGISALHVGVAS